VFGRTLNAVSALLSTEVIRKLNYDVDLAHQDPADVAKRFLEDNGLIPTPAPTS
jgi:glycine betaine/choline ABC-type transport system substrate-binding protein